MPDADALRASSTPYDNAPQIDDARARSTAYHGVTRRGSVYKARIRNGDRVVNLGTFDNPIAAAVAYDRAVDLLLDTKARKNFE